MPTSTIQPSPQKILPLSAHPTHPPQSQLPHSHFKTPQLQPIHQPQPLLQTALYRSPHLHPPPPPPSINSRHAREGRLATPHSHMHLTLTLGFLGRTGRCCFYRSKTTSSQFLRSGRLRSTLHRLVRIIRFDSARSWFIATSLSTIRLPSSSTPSALFLP